MRRFASLFMLVVLVAAVGPASVAAAPQTRCTIEVTPSTGSGTTVYRITGHDIPVPDGGSAEVRLDIRRLGSRAQTTIFLLLVTGATEFSFDYNQAEPGEPNEPLAAGRYRVRAETPHGTGCHATSGFIVA